MKYTLTDNTKIICGITLRQIKALKAFSNVEVGELGGWIESESNLDQYGEAWVSGEARVYGEAQVCGEAQVFGEARVCGKAKIENRNDYITIAPIGSRNDCLTLTHGMAFNGCFSGTWEKLLEASRQKHGAGSKHNAQYAKAIDFAKSFFNTTQLEAQ